MNHHETYSPHQTEMLWQLDSQRVTEILNRGAQDFLSENQLETEPAQLECACIDERVEGAKLALPGSGILLGMDRALEILKAAKVAAVSSHADCGAAKIAFDKLPPAEQEKYSSADQYAQAWTKELAFKLNVPYAGHHEVETPNLHTARAVYYDGSGYFRADEPDFPKGFTVSRAFTTSEEAKDSLLLSLKIALGDHGFGQKFNSENPLLIIPVGESAQIPTLQKEISAVLKQYPELTHAVKVDDGYVPEQIEQEAEVA